MARRGRPDRPKVPKLAAIMEERRARRGCLYGLSQGTSVKLHSINPIERLNGRDTQAPDRRCWASSPLTIAIIRLVGAIPAEQNDEWAVRARDNERWKPSLH